VEGDESVWRRCSTCKKPIAFAGAYFTCSVSTCNRRGTDFAFCSVACWDGHVPVLRHRDAWADEQRAPSAEEWTRQQRAAAQAPPPSAAPKRPAGAGGEAGMRPGASGAEPVPRDVLVVVSKLKLYVRAKSGMNCSDGVVDVLSDRLRALCDRAIASARAAGRKTVLDRDFSGG
jgi:hypothetical protein